MSSSLPSSEVLTGRIRRYFIQLTSGCGRRGCDNPHCATGSGRPLTATEAATRAVHLVQTGHGQLCDSHSSPDGQTQTQSLRISTENSSERSAVQEEVGVERGRSEVTLLHPQMPARPALSEPMELAFTSSDVRDHSPPGLVIGSSSSSMVQPFFRTHRSTSGSVGSHTTTATTTASSSSSSSSSTSYSGPMLGSSSSSSSSSALVHMASSNMVEEVARMEVSPTPHHTHPSPSSSSAAVHPSKPADTKKKSSPHSIPVRISTLFPTSHVCLYNILQYVCELFNLITCTRTYMYVLFFFTLPLHYAHTSVL